MASDSALGRPVPMHPVRLELSVNQVSQNFRRVAALVVGFGPSLRLP
jgi:hypothetical protein